MTHSLLFDQLAAELGRRGRGAAGAAVMVRLAASGVDVAGFADPLEVALCCRAVGTPRARRSLAAVAALVPGDETAALVVLVALAPALRAMARRLGRTGLALDDAEALVAGTALDVLVGVPRAGDVASAVLSGVWARCRREVRRERRRAVARAGSSPGSCGPPAAVDEEAILDPVLARAVRRGVLGPRHAAVVAETRVLGRPLVEVAAEWGVTPGALTSLRRRAEGRLRAMVADEARSEGASR